MSYSKLIIKDCELENIDFDKCRGVARIPQKVYFLKNKKKLHPALLNKELAKRIKNDKEVLEELCKLISDLLVKKFGLGKYGMFTVPPEVKIEFLRYETDMKNKMDLLIYFSFS